MSLSWMHVQCVVEVVTRSSNLFLCLKKKSILDVYADRNKKSGNKFLNGYGAVFFVIAEGASVSRFEIATQYTIKE